MPTKTQKFLEAVPKTIKIGPLSWTIVIDRMASDTEGGLPPFGKTEYLQQVIRVNPDLAAPATCVGTLIHELYHAGLFSFGINQPRSEEQGATAVEAVYTSIFCDNPRLLDWIKKGLS